MAGHCVAVCVLNPSGEFGLLPMTLIFIYLPAYIYLLLAVFIGQAIAQLMRTAR
jgi:hypothetical protein